MKANRNEVKLSENTKSMSIVGQGNEEITAVSHIMSKQKIYIIKNKKYILRKIKGTSDGKSENYIGNTSGCYMPKMYVEKSVILTS